MPEVDGDVDVEAPSPEPDPAKAWARLRRALTMRPSRGQWLVAVLCALLGFGLALQVRTVGTEESLSGARPEDLVRLLDSLDERGQRLDDRIRELERTRSDLVGARDQAEAAEQARAERARDLGVLAGTLPAAGPGVRLGLAGPVRASLILDAIQELRDAGAEAQQIGDVRVVASTSVLDGPEPGTVVVDGRTVTAPFELLAIGDPATMASALRIPGGVADRAAADEVELTIAQEERVRIDAVRAPPS
jgi:uncharacterized protein YlxW (UPF0749 family)